VAVAGQRLSPQLFSSHQTESSFGTKFYAMGPIRHVEIGTIEFKFDSTCDPRAVSKEKK